jgi:spore maturation protein CgeB
MSKAAYIGIRNVGTTSFLRSEALRRALPDWEWSFVDTDAPFRRASRLWRSLAFRWRVGKAVQDMNRHVIAELPPGSFDLIWVDKGVCLYPETIRRLRSQSRRLVYYTPDTSFLHNRSRFFERTVNFYDLVVTTKSLELEHYHVRLGADRVLLTTQSYDRQLHYPRVDFTGKRPEVVFIGLCEPSREACLDELLQAGIPVRVGGVGWDRFVARHKTNRLMTFEGQAVFGEHYASVLSMASIGLGLLTQRFPELHTTRTFEIPACATAIATPMTVETRKVFDDSQAIFFDDYKELARRILHLMSLPAELQKITEAGHKRVLDGPYDNDSMVQLVLSNLGVVTGYH